MALHASAPAGDPPRTRATPIGTLWLDAPTLPVDLPARVAELALDGARDRAEADRAARRLDALDEATRAIAGVLSADRVLQVIVDQVRGLAGARYAALGIAGPGRRHRAVHHQRDQPRRPRPDRGAAARPRHPRPDHPREPDAPARRPRWPTHARLGFPPEPPADAPVPRRAGHGPRPHGRQPLPDRQATARVHRRRPADSSRCSPSTPGSPSRTPASTSRSSGWRSSRSASGSARTSTTAIIQAIYAVGLSLEDVPEMMDDEPDEARRRVERAIDSLDQTIRDIRNFIFGLRPAAPRRRRPRRGARRPGRRVPGQHDDRRRAARRPARSRRRTSAPTGPPSCSPSPARRSATSPATPGRRAPS